MVINSVIQWVFENGNVIRERVLWHDTQTVVTIDIEDRNANPAIRDISVIDEALASNCASFIPWDNKFLFNPEKSPPRTLKLWELAKETVRFLMKPEHIPRIFQPRLRAKIIIEASEKYNISRSSCYKYLRIFLQNGMNDMALVPRLFLCGKPKDGTERNITKKLGAPTKESKINPEAVGVIITEDIKRKFRIAAALLLKHGKTGLGIPAAYNYMLNKFFRIGGTEEQPILPPIYQRPSLSQFKYFIETNITKEDQLKSTVGDKDFQCKYRSVLGDSLQETFAPGSRYQIDATVTRIWIVSNIDRRIILGRPVVYFAIDVYSRMVVGMHISLEGPNWECAKMVLYNVTLDKVEFCKKYDIDITSDMWPCRCLPEVLLADRGEILSIPSDNMVEGFNMTIENAPSRRGDAKGVVERYFRTSEEKWVHWVPGNVVKDYRKFGDKDPRRTAAFTLDEFTTVIIVSVLEHNHSIIRGYKKEAKMIIDRVKARPIDLWNWGVRTKGGNIPNYPDEVIKYHLLTPGKATITAVGLSFQGALYKSNIPEYNKWFSQVRYLKRSEPWTVEIRYNHAVIDVIFVLIGNPGKLVPFYLNDSQQIIRGKTFAEWAVHKENEDWTTRHEIEAARNMEAGNTAKIINLSNKAAKITARVNANNPLSLKFKAKLSKTFKTHEIAERKKRDIMELASDLEKEKRRPGTGSTTTYVSGADYSNLIDEIL